MTNHPGDYNSFLHLARMREEHLERKQRHHALIQDAPYRPGLRAGIAGFLRTMADRLESRPLEATQPRRYQRAP